MNLTSKELTALEDQMGAEQVIIKKYRAYASIATDKNIKTKCTQIADKHQEHFNTLMGLLG